VKLIEGSIAARNNTKGAKLEIETKVQSIWKNGRKKIEKGKFKVEDEKKLIRMQKISKKSENWGRKVKGKRRKIR